MASAPQAQGLPLFYNDLQPLSSDLHADYRIRRADSAPFLATQHAVPLTVEEFPLVQRYLPIVFSVGDDPVPLGLMGLNEGVNVFFGADGRMREAEPFYIPAYVRRYPYMLARLRPDAEELSLCFDPTSDAIGAFMAGLVIAGTSLASRVERLVRPLRDGFAALFFFAADQLMGWLLSLVLNISR